MTAKKPGDFAISTRSRLFPELRLFENEAQRREAVHQATHGLLLTRRSIVTIILVALVSFVAVDLPMSWVRPGRLRTEVVDALSVVFVVLASSCAFSYVWRRRIQHSLREQLRQLGVPVCEKCGYDLRGSIESARCPECNTPFVPPNLPAGTPAEAPEKGRQGSAESGR